jgi:thymidylate synthase
MTYILHEYDKSLEYILRNGVRKTNRTSVDTLSVFGMQTRYNISTNFPILTKRKMFYKSIFAELLWVLSGSTNVNDLEALGSKIWTSWRDKEFEEKHGYSDGELGPIYGWNLRHFGEDYNNRNNSPGGFDQLKYVVDELKNNPESRRILFTYWNPNNLGKAVLPPCHHTFQLNVEGDKLSGLLFQRSCDVPIGCCANFQYYSALIYMLAQQVGLKPYELIHSVSDAHIYVNQIEAVEEYLSRQPIDSPRLILNKAQDIYSYKMEDFVVEDYNPLAAIKIPVVVR